MDGQIGYLGVKEHAAHDLGVVHGRLEVIERARVVLVCSMGKVEACDIHACPEKLLEYGNFARLWPQRANDFCLGNSGPRVTTPPPQYTLNICTCHGARLTLSSIPKTLTLRYCYYFCHSSYMSNGNLSAKPQFVTQSTSWGSCLFCDGGVQMLKISLPFVSNTYQNAETSQNFPGFDT